MHRALPLALLPTVVALSTTLLAQTGNIHPDPSFERTGVECDAHSGVRAGHLAVGERQHWVTLGGPLPVEPFATYKATAWVKGGAAEGSALALYAYQWDSFVWAFSANAPVPSRDEWREVSVTFAVPQDTVFLHPLAFMDAAQGEAWIDDIVVEKVLSPEGTIAQIRAKDQRSDDDERLLAHYDLEFGDGARRWSEFPEHASNEANADIACVRALHPDLAAKRPELLARMLTYGAPAYNMGWQRVDEAAAGIAPDRLTDAIAAEMASVGDNAGAVRWLGEAMLRLGGIGRGTGTLAAREAALDRVATAFSQAAAGASGEDAKRQVDEFLGRVTTMQDELAAERAALGNARLVIAGKAVSPETHTIAIDVNATPQEKLAARDLQAHIEKITGLCVPISADADPDNTICIVVGKSALTHEIGVGVDYEALGDEGVRIATKGPHLALTGGKRGVLYAVYTFLEDYLGCRWFTPDCMTWPTEGRLTVPPLNVTYIPPLEYRATDYPNSLPPEFAVRNKYNGTQIHATEEWGGKISYRGFVHTFNSLVPPETYFDAHPEYFSEIGGERVRDWSQLCLTNPDVLRIATETVRQWIRESPEATIISVSQNDWHNPCQCPNCRKLAEEEGSESGPLLHFVNAIADDVAKDYPHIIIDTLAYQYTRKPPLHVRPRPNVAIRLCSIECEFNHPLEGSAYNATFVDDIHGWNRICDRLHIWDYVINYAHCVQPFPNLNVLQPNIRFFIENGVTGIYEEANYFSRGGEFAELRTYLMAKLLWDPDYDVQRGIDEFCAAYYGPAAPRIRDYIDDIHRLAVSDPDFHMRIYVPPTAPFQTDEALTRYEGWFDEAEAAVADDPVRLHRVEVARLPVIYTRLAQATDPQYQLMDEGLVPDKTSDVSALADDFERIAAAEGLTAVSEGGWGHDWRGWLNGVRARGGKRAEVERLRGGGLEAVVAPSIGGKILTLTRLSDAEPVLQVERSGDRIVPTSGGYKEFSESGYQSPGWSEPYEVLERSDNSILMGADLSNGLRLERRITLAADRPVVEIESTLRNVSDGPRTGCIRVHPCLRLHDPEMTRVRFGPPGAEEKPITDLRSGDQREWWLRGDAVPPGEWALIDEARNMTVISRFDRQDMLLCYLNWDPNEHRANLEFWTPDHTLQPGESFSVKHAYEVVGG